jgi:hypothetical protein
LESSEWEDLAKSVPAEDSSLDLENSTIPDEWNWVTKGIVTPPKSQGLAKKSI